MGLYDQFLQDQQPKGGLYDDFLQPVKSQPEPQAQPEAHGQGDFWRGLRAGSRGLQQIGTGALGAGFDLLGMDEKAKRFYDKSLAYGEQAQAASVGSPTSFSDDVTDFESFIDWAQYTAGQGLPSLAAAAGSAVVGAAGAPVVGAGAATGALAGVFGAGTVLGGGEIASEQAELVEQGAIDETRPGVALGGGLASGAVNAAPVIGAFKALGLMKPFQGAVARRIARSTVPGKIAAGAALGGVAEGATELADEAIILGARDVVQEEFEALGPEGRKRLKDALAAGGLMGVLVGGTGGAFVRNPESGYEGVFNPEQQFAEAAQREIDKQDWANKVADENAEIVAKALQDDLKETESRLAPEFVEEAPEGSYEAAEAILDEESNLEVTKEIAEEIKDAVAAEYGMEVASDADPLATNDPTPQEKYEQITTEEVVRRYEEDLEPVTDEDLQPAVFEEEVIENEDGTVDTVPAEPPPPKYSAEQVKWRGRYDNWKRQPEVAQALGVMDEAANDGTRLLWTLNEAQEAGVMNTEMQGWLNIATAWAERQQATDQIGDEGAGFALQEAPTMEGIFAADGIQKTIPQVYDEVVMALERGQQQTPEPTPQFVEEEAPAIDYFGEEEQVQPDPDPMAGAALGDYYEALLQEEGLGEIKYSRTERPNQPAVPVPDMVSYVEGLRPIPGVNLQTTYDPQNTGNKGQIQIADDGTAAVTLNLAAHTNQEDVLNTYVHEIAGHYGLSRLGSLSDETFVGSLQKTFPQLWQDTQQTWGLEGGDTQAIADEVFARVAEQYVQAYDESLGFTVAQPKDMGPLRKAVSFIQDYVKKLYSKITGNPIKLSDRMVRDLVKQSVDKVQEGRPVPTEPVVRQKTEAEQAAASLDEAAGTEFAKAVGSTTAGFKRNFMSMFLTPIQIARLKANNFPDAQLYVDAVQNGNTEMDQFLRDKNQIAAAWERNDQLSNAMNSTFVDVVLEENRRDTPLTEGEFLKIAQKHGLDKHQTTYQDPHTLEKTRISGLEMYERVKEATADARDQMHDGVLLRTIRQTQFGRNRDEALQYRDQVWLDMPLAQREELVAKQTELLKDPTIDPEEAAQYELNRTLLSIDKVFDRWGQRTYFPFNRYGRYSIIIESAENEVHDGVPLPRGSLLSYSTYVDEKEQNKAATEAKKAFRNKNVNIKLHKMSDVEFDLMDMPVPLMRTLKEDLKLTPEQVTLLEKVNHQYSPSRSILKHLEKKQHIHGFSHEGKRAFSNYMFSTSKALQRLNWSLEMQAHLNNLKVSNVQETSREGGVAIVDQRERDWLYQYYAKHYDYITNPTSEWEILRTMGFYWYLTNPKSAAVNMLHVPMVLAPYAASKYGAGAAARVHERIIPVMNDMAVSKIGGKKKRALSKLEVDFMDRALDEGLITDTFVENLMRFQQKSRALQAVAGKGYQRQLSKLDNAATFFFRNTEELGRRIAISSFTRILQKQNPNWSKEQLWQQVKKDVQNSMYVYSSWNRPSFMRGKKGNLFLFRQYMQGTMFLMGGGEGKKAGLYTSMALLAGAGLMGMPFVEDIAGLWDMSMRQFNKMFGLPYKHSDPDMTVRKFFRNEWTEQYAKPIHDNPDLMLYGLMSRYGLGPAHLANFIGLPVPDVDVSGSVGMGGVVPGIQEATAYSSSSGAKFQRMTESLLGPLGGIAGTMYRGFESQDPDTWKRIEGMLPPVAKNVSGAVRRASRGEETFPGGGTMVEYDLEDTEDVLSLLAKGASFETSRVRESQRQRGYMAQLTAGYGGYRSAILKRFAHAVYINDSKAKKEALYHIRQYNRDLPTDLKGLAILPDTIDRSVESYATAARKRELGIPRQEGLAPRVLSHKEYFPKAANRRPAPPPPT